MHLYSFLTRKKEIFQPKDDHKVKIFTCGPSIYKRPHIGNYRTFLYEDLLVRYLKYLGYKVERVIVFTDVEDKGIETAHDNVATLKKMTHDSAKHFFKEIKILDIDLPRYIPKTADSVKASTKIIKKLLSQGIAYYFENDIYFDPAKKKDFGKLFHLDMQKWPNKHIHYKRDNYEGNHWYLGDFILWHHAKSGDKFSWQTSLGKGRPSWYIQDSAIILNKLGSQIDINCGGIDNIYRHHDYTIAIMESYSKKSFANYYLLGEHLYVDGKKMSKSLGNIVYPLDLISKRTNAKHVRFYLGFGRHYRKKLYYTKAKFNKQLSFLNEFNKLVHSILGKKPVQLSEGANSFIESVQVKFETHMNDDLDLPAAFKAVLGVLKKLEKLSITKKQQGALRRTLKAINSVWAVLS